MATYTKEFFSVSDYGAGILITSASSPGTLIHTTSEAVSKDEIWLYAVNTSTSGITITLEYGGTTSPNYIVPLAIEAQSGFVPIIPGTLLSNSKEIRMFSSIASTIVVYGFINRIT